mmetsp:Transcript_13801/g.34680  ORF Transcript_13801/g.34680 Transcript_13801/m.34680 type:complete len:109 (+) Transcript_13801:2-328(+)
MCLGFWEGWRWGRRCIGHDESLRRITREQAMQLDPKTKFPSNAMCILQSLVRQWRPHKRLTLCNLRDLLVSQIVSYGQASEKREFEEMAKWEIRRHLEGTGVALLGAK